MNKPEKKILYVQPSVSDEQNKDSSERLNEIQQYLDANTSPGYKVNFKYITCGGELPTSEYYISVSAPYIVEEVLKCEQEGYKGVIIGCFGNLAVRESREVVRIPIVGPGEAACHIACLLGERIAIVTTGAGIEHKNFTLNEKYHHQFYLSIRRELQAQGLLDRFVSIRTTNLSSAGGLAALTAESLDYEIRALLDQGRKAIEEDGADVLVLGCALMIGVADRLQEELGIPIVDPTLTSIRVAEMLISMNLSHSVLSYPFTNVEADKCPIIYPPALKGYHWYKR